MSLINDALKRASTSKDKSQAAPGMASMQPVEQSAPKSGPLPMILCIVGISSLIMAGAFWLKSKGTPPATGSVQQQAKLETPQAVAQQLPVQKTEVASSAPISSTNSEANPAQNPVQRAVATFQKVQARNQEGESEVEKMVAPAATPTAPLERQVPAAAKNLPHQANTSAKAQNRTETAAPPSGSNEPAFKLHAIYYRLKGPTVVINGKTLKLGDSIDGAKVTGIERNAVELERNGAKEKLTLR
jgi:hypothetical protein